jgi:hypothetical protein
MALDRERYARDYSLFATKRNEVYADTFGLLEKAHGAYSAKFDSLRAYRDYSRSSIADLRNVAKRLELVCDSERQGLIEAIDSDSIDTARARANALNEHDEFRRANWCFYEFRANCALFFTVGGPFASPSGCCAGTAQRLGG